MTCTSIFNILIEHYFNSHPHEEDDMLTSSYNMNNRLFQLTSSRRGWHHTGFPRPIWKHFNSHPHEEDDVRALSHLSDQDISTHILTKRMTNTGMSFTYINAFQLTSSRRGWRTAENPAVRKKLFQLTSSRRGWHYVPVEADLVNDISTHILTKRMTVYPTATDFLEANFNSHPHEEDDSNFKQK